MNPNDPNVNPGLVNLDGNLTDAPEMPNPNPEPGFAAPATEPLPDIPPADAGLEQQLAGFGAFARLATSRIRALEIEVSELKQGREVSGLSPETVHLLEWARAVLSKWFAKEKPDEPKSSSNG